MTDEASPPTGESLERMPDRPTLGQLAELTPLDRDRFVDFLRAASIVLVVCGHWLIATVVRDDGQLEGTNALAAMSWLSPVTWVFQVMPVFFIVGGFSNLRSFESSSTGRADWAGFLVRRADRLLRPTVAFAAVWMLLAAVVTAVVDDAHLARDASRIAAQPLWFLAVYLLVVTVAPLQLRLHRAIPGLLVAILPVVVVLFDVLRLNEVAEDIATFNYLAVFLFAQELGFFYADRRFDGLRLRTVVATALAAAGVLAVLTTVGPYPVSMVGLPGTRISNMSPPTVCILVLTVAQGATLLVVRQPVTRWLGRARPWHLTVAVNVVVLTLFLWHLTALLTTGAALLALGLEPPGIGTGAWWAQRVLWFGGSAIVLALLVAAFSPIERLPSHPRPFGPPVLRVVGAFCAFAGLAGFALAGFAHATTTGGRALLGVRFSPTAAFVLLVGGWLLTVGLPRRDPPPT